jgi:hypothetical protein
MSNFKLQIVTPYSGACIKIKTTTPYNPPPAKLCIPPKKGYNISALTLRPYWIFNINEGCNFLTGQVGKCSINAAFCKPFESVFDAIFNITNRFYYLLYFKRPPSL